MRILDKLLKLLKIRQQRALLFIFQPQDLDLLLPIAKNLRDHGTGVEALLHPRVVESSPRIRKAFDESGLKWTQTPQSNFLLLLKVLRFSALITAADTTARAHRPSYKLVKLANFLGLKTYTLQHGLENIGLTYYDKEYPPAAVDFASETIFTWCDRANLSPLVPSDIQRRCFAVGCPKEYRAEEVPNIHLPFSWKKLVVVFENLHWSRYDEAYREQFLQDLEATAKQFPDVSILVKPHHAGRWLTSRYKGKLPSSPNLIIADPTDPIWEPYTAPALIKIADAVITTPSTTVFDTVSMDKGVAVVGYDLDLPLYSLLPILRSASDWNNFFEQLHGSEFQSNLLQRSLQFKDLVNLPGSAVTRITEHINRSL